jgi:hypothetical protein
MGASQRRKGVVAERELKNMLKESFPEFAEDISRNWQAQSAEGGLDIVGIPKHPIECKFVKDFYIKEHWPKLLDDIRASKENDLDVVCPVLFRKVSQQGWTAYIHVRYIFGNREVQHKAKIEDTEMLVRLPYKCAVAVIRGSLGLKQLEVSAE